MQVLLDTRLGYGLVPVRGNQRMNREERIAEARRRPTEHAPQLADLAQKRARDLYRRLSDVGASPADRHVADAEQRWTAPYLDPTATPKEWGQAVEPARPITIMRALRRGKLTHRELRWVILDELEMLVDDTKLEELLAISPESAGVLLGAIIVHPGSGKPSDDFLLAAMELSFDDPADVLQRQVYEHFG